MLCINNTYTDICFNLAAEEFFFKNLSDDIFILWESESAVVVGKHQNVFTDVDLEAAKKKNIKVLRRFSGDGTVYEDSGVLNMTYILHTSNPDFNKLHKQTLDSLKRIGLRVESDENNNILIDNNAIAEVFHYINKDRAIFHVGLLLSSDLNVMANLLKKGEKDLNYTNINDHISNPLPMEVFRRLMISFFFENNPNNLIYSFSENDISSINAIMDEKCNSAEWNLSLAQK